MATSTRSKISDNCFFSAMHFQELGRVLSIEEQIQSVPWSLQLFEESLVGQHICRVLKVESQIQAFHIVCPILDELHILNLAVAANAQGQGFGHLLMHNVFEIAENNASKKIFLEVRASNLIAQSLYSKWQFKQIAVRKNYYRTADNQREDGMIYMFRCLQEVGR